MTGASAFYWLSREGTNNIESQKGEIVANSDKFNTVGGYKYSEINPSQR